MANTDPSTTSGDYKSMMDYWQKVDDLYLGAEAVRAARERYLPKFENETQKQYDDRVRWARYTNIYGDILSNLSSKPFTEEVSLPDASPKYGPLVEDIDGQGNNLHNFAKSYFKDAINFVVDWIYVDYTKVNPNTVDANGRVRRKSVTEERQAGARPYWVKVSALEMIAVYSAVINGVEMFVHCRMVENTIERDGYDEVTVQRIRELNREPILDENEEIIDYAPATWRLWRKAEAGWIVEDEGPVQIGIIPIVPLIIGERETSTSWQLIGELRDCADLQIDLYQQECALQNARQLTAFPMLSADGVDPQMESYIDEEGNTRERPVRAPVGPRSVLYGGSGSDGGPGGSWKYVEINASSLTFLASEIKSTIQELRELGRQPLTAQSGNLTTITTAYAAQKGNSAVQAWALALKDALELAFRYSAMWMGEADGPSVFVFTDFQKGLGEDDGFDDVLAMRKDGDLSQETLWDEAKRRGRLGEEFTVEREIERIGREGQDQPDYQDIMDALNQEQKDEDDIEDSGDDLD